MPDTSWPGATACPPPSPTEDGDGQNVPFDGKTSRHRPARPSDAPGTTGPRWLSDPAPVGGAFGGAVPLPYRVGANGRERTKPVGPRDARRTAVARRWPAPPTCAPRATRSGCDWTAPHRGVCPCRRPACPGAGWRARPSRPAPAPRSVSRPEWLGPAPEPVATATNAAGSARGVAAEVSAHQPRHRCQHMGHGPPAWGEDGSEQQQPEAVEGGLVNAMRNCSTSGASAWGN